LTKPQKNDCSEEKRQAVGNWRQVMHASKKKIEFPVYRGKQVQGEKNVWGK